MMEFPDSLEPVANPLSQGKMNHETLIQVESVSKKFCRRLKRSLWYGVQDIGVELLGRQKMPELRTDEFWAVCDVSFELRRGECLGLIGSNGAGKSTMLKMLNGLIMPDKGRITIKGRVGALIELGTGFNPILTGRENIYNNGAVLGFTQKEINEKFDSIVEFAEIGDFLDTPVQNYSSGMKVRLGFAVAAHMEPDVLLVDEVLAVGDMGFIMKCFNQMDRLLQNAAMILVSHNMPQISRQSTQILLMDHGVGSIYEEPSAGVTDYYRRYKQEIIDFQNSDKAVLRKIRIGNDHKMYERTEDFVVEYGEDFFIEMDIVLWQKVKKPNLSLALYDREQRVFAQVWNFREHIDLENYAGELKVKAKIRRNNFAQGKYSITVILSDEATGSREILLRVQSAIFFTVNSKIHEWAPIQIDHFMRNFTPSSPILCRITIRIISMKSALAYREGISYCTSENV
jgi:lipopolysaccharide transport system ATP-binding protein